MRIIYNINKEINLKNRSNNKDVKIRCNNKYIK